MQHAKTAFIATAAVLAAGCATSFRPTIVSAGDTGVTYRIPTERLDETGRTAEEYCNSRGRTARLQSVSPAGNNQSIAVFVCA